MRRMLRTLTPKNICLLCYGREANLMRMFYRRSNICNIWLNQLIVNSIAPSRTNPGSVCAAGMRVIGRYSRQL